MSVLTIFQLLPAQAAYLLWVVLPCGASSVCLACAVHAVHGHLLVGVLIGCFALVNLCAVHVAHGRLLDGVH